MNEETLNELRKDFYKELLAEYVAKVIQLEFRTFGNNKSKSYNNIFQSCLKNYKLNKEERKILFDFVDQIVLNKYNLLIANASKDECLYIVDIEKER